MEFNTFRWTLGYFLMISLQIHQLCGQSCIAPQEVGKETEIQTPEECASHKVELETGIDFMLNSEVELDEDLRYDTNPYGAAWQEKNKMPAWDMVQLFLRKIKRLPEKPQGKNAIFIWFENERKDAINDTKKASLMKFQLTFKMKMK
jgi:hypothetical protein